MKLCITWLLTELASNVDRVNLSKSLIGRGTPDWGNLLLHVYTSRGVTWQNKPIEHAFEMKPDEL